MLGLTAATRIYLYRGVCNMRESEQLNPNQLMFDSIILESPEQNAQQAPPVAEIPVQPGVVKTRKASQHHGRVPIPEHLERVEILLDIPVPLQVKGNGKLKKARLWAYVRGGTGPPLTAYDFSIDRSEKRPLDFLDGYQGYVHADAYSGYDELFRKEGIVEVGCWAHARRKFDEAATSRPKEATDVLARIARLYHEVETPCADMQPEERRRNFSLIKFSMNSGGSSHRLPRTTPSENIFQDKFTGRLPP